MQSLPADRPHGQGRLIEKLEVRTPLIVPSFSSRGFPDVGEIYHEMKHRLHGVCLVSSLDMGLGCIPTDVTDDVDLVIIDSGGYERQHFASESVGYATSGSNVVWSRHLYHAIASLVDPAANTIVVNFDEIRAIDEQISQALEDFAYAPQAAWDFLVKPERLHEAVNVAKLATQTNALRQFDIVGVAARDASISLIKRCRTIVMLRDALSDAGLNPPIHIMGAIRPIEVLTYYFCGADIFDGLNWLRYSFKEEGSRHIEDAAFETTGRNLSDAELLLTERAANLTLLYHLQESLRYYGSTGDMNELMKDFPSAKRAAGIAELAGAVISTG